MQTKLFVYVTHQQYHVPYLIFENMLENFRVSMSFISYIILFLRSPVLKLVLLQGAEEEEAVLSPPSLITPLSPHAHPC